MQPQALVGNAHAVWSCNSMLSSPSSYPHFPRSPTARNLSEKRCFFPRAFCLLLLKFLPQFGTPTLFTVRAGDIRGRGPWPLSVNKSEEEISYKKVPAWNNSVTRCFEGQNRHIYMGCNFKAEREALNDLQIRKWLTKKWLQNPRISFVIQALCYFSIYGDIIGLKHSR